MSCKTEKVVVRGEETLFGKEDDYIIEQVCESCANKTDKNHNGIYVRIMNWKKKRRKRFVDILD